MLTTKAAATRPWNTERTQGTRSLPMLCWRKCWPATARRQQRQRSDGADSVEESIVPECPTCGKQLEPTVRFCPEDGTPLADTAAATPTRTSGERRTQVKELDLPLVLGNRYKLVEARGGGGMAKVYRALDLTLEREVA